MVHSPYQLWWWDPMIAMIYDVVENTSQVGKIHCSLSISNPRLPWNKGSTPQKIRNLTNWHQELPFSKGVTFSKPWNRLLVSATKTPVPTSLVGSGYHKIIKQECWTPWWVQTGKIQSNISGINVSFRECISLVLTYFYPPGNRSPPSW